MSKLGALLPENMKWQEGKTAATIAFVNEAEVYIATHPRTARVVVLEDFVKNLKMSIEVLTDWLTIEELFATSPYNSME